MELQLKKLIVKNFKGIKSIEIDFNEITNIEGENRGRKTSVFDAVTWLWFGKDSKGKTDSGVGKFNIKPLDKNNKTIPKLETEVLGVYDTDGKELKIMRTRKEDWTKPRGKPKAVLTGHTTFYEWNDSDISKAEFEKRKNELLEEKLFKLITDPLLFNALDWKVRRNMLISLIPEFCFTSDSKYCPLSDKEIEEKRKSLASQIKKIKEKLKEIPIQITEAKRSKPEPENWDEIFKDKQMRQQEVVIIENQIIDKSKVLTRFNESRMKEQKELADLKSELDLFVSDFELKHNQEKRDLEKTITAKKTNIHITKTEIERLGSNIESSETTFEFHNKERGKRLKEWHKFNESVFKEGLCSNCKQKWPQEDIDKQKVAFKNHKDTNLDRISSEGKKIHFKLGELNQKIKNYNTEIQNEETSLQASVNELSDLEAKLKMIATPDIETDTQYKTLSHLHQEAKEVFEKDEPPIINIEKLKSQKEANQKEIDLLKLRLDKRTQIATAESRVKELGIQETMKANILVDLEQTEFEIEDFVKSKITALEAEINKKFKFVKFKMFEQQINGGEKEVCTTLFNGVPWHDVNSEGKINGGLDIINTFSKHYDICAPIFIDNRESTTEIIETEAQIINLIVNPKFKTLKIS